MGKSKKRTKKSKSYKNSSRKLKLYLQFQKLAEERPLTDGEVKEMNKLGKKVATYASLPLQYILDNHHIFLKGSSAYNRLQQEFENNRAGDFSALSQEDLVSKELLASNQKLADGPQLSPINSKSRKKLDPVPKDSGKRNKDKKKDNRDNSSRPTASRYFDLAQTGADSDAVHKLLRVAEGSRARSMCLLCANQFHQVSNCPKSACGICGKIGHTSAMCNETKKKRCTFCGRLGHLQKDCPQKRMILEEEDMSEFFDDVSGTEGHFNINKHSDVNSRYCFNCGEKGHTGFDCDMSMLEEVDEFWFDELMESKLPSSKKKRRRLW